MSFEDDMRARHGRVLGELAETGMVMVRELSAAMLATDDRQTQAQLGLAYHRVSRAVRQTVALEFRLFYERPREARLAPPAAAPKPTPSRPPAIRTGWDEYERDDSREKLDDLDDLLDAESLDMDAIHDTVEACLDGIRRDLDIDLASIVRPAAPPRPPPALAIDTWPPSVAPPNLPGASRRSTLLGAGASLRPPPPPPWPSSA